MIVSNVWSQPCKFVNISLIYNNKTANLLLCYIFYWYIYWFLIITLLVHNLDPDLPLTGVHAGFTGGPVNAGGKPGALSSTFRLQTLHRRLGATQQCSGRCHVVGVVTGTDICLHNDMILVVLVFAVADDWRQMMMMLMLSSHWFRWRCSDQGHWQY